MISKFTASEVMQHSSVNSTDSDMFDVEQSSTELSPRTYITPKTLNSTELSGAPAIEHITLSSLESLEPQLITILSDSNEPNILMGAEGKTQ